MEGKGGLGRRRGLGGFEGLQGYLGFQSKHKSSSHSCQVHATQNPHVKKHAQHVTEHTAVFLQTAKSAPPPRPRLSPEHGADRVVRSPSAAPTTPAEEESSASSGSDSSEVSGVSGESQLEGEGVAEASGVIRACQDKGESLWTPGVICRLFETPDNVFPEATKAMEEQAGSAGDAAAPDAAAASTEVAAGAAAVHAEDRSKVPFQFAVCDIQTRAFDSENADDRGCRRELGACSTGYPYTASAPSAAAGSFEPGLPEPWPDSRGARVCTSKATVCGSKFFRGSIRGLRKRSGSGPSCYRKCQPAALDQKHRHSTLSVSTA